MEALSPAELFALIATVEFKPLSAELKNQVYTGVESEKAFIYEGDYFTLILDGNIVQLLDFEGNFETYTLSLM
jgi:hypothetical protein